MDLLGVPDGLRLYPQNLIRVVPAKGNTMFKFDSPVCLVGEGELPETQFRSLYSDGSPLIAADGGANYLRAWNVLPHAVVGDMDSLEDRDYFETHSQVLHVEDQDTTDLEKCLLRTEAPYFYALGFIGNRFDHTLEILHFLEKYPQKQIFFFSKQDVIFKIPRVWEAELPVGTRLSLYPLRETALRSSRGLKYPLDGLTMAQGQQIGTSNETDAPSLRIEQETAGLIGIVPYQFHHIITQSTL